jgi:hypothetical protein
MTQQGEAKRLSVGEEPGDVVVTAHGTRVEIHADGSILAYTDGPVKVQPDDPDRPPKLGVSYKVVEMDPIRDSHAYQT